MVVAPEDIHSPDLKKKVQAGIVEGLLNPKRREERMNSIKEALQESLKEHMIVKPH